MSKKKDLEKLKKREAKIALEQQQSAEVWSLAREFADHPARGLTPQKLHNILVAAEQGDIIAQSNLCLDMEERDGHIYCEMSKRKRALLTLDWHVEPPKNATAAEKALATEVQEWLENIEDFEDVMLDALDGIGHGFAALEMEWELLGNLQLPCKFNHRPQSWFQTPHDNFNELRLRDGTMDGAELWPLGWLVHKHKAKSGYLTRSGLHRVIWLSF
jgi:phage gp29-like protein